MESPLSSLFVTFFLTVVNGIITGIPENAAADVGDRVIFSNCNSSHPYPSWVFATKREDVGTPSSQLIAYSCAIQEGFETDYEAVQMGSDSCNLIVKSATMALAGLYTCTDAQGQGPSAILTVVDTRVEVNNGSEVGLVEGDQLTMSCFAQYNSSTQTIQTPTLEPYVNWTDSSGNTIASSYYSSTSSLILANISITVERQDIQPYTCSVRYEINWSTAVSSNFAQNIPSETSNASSPHFEVLYYPYQIQITPSFVGKCIYEEETLTCSAMGNPMPSYEWRNIKDTTAAIGSTLTISRGGQYQCIATNIIRGQNYSANATLQVDDCVPVTTDNITITGSSCVSGTCSCVTGSSEVNLTCQVYSLPEPNYYEWKFDRQGEMGRTQAISAKYNGLYNCTVCNNFTASQQFCGAAAVIVVNCYTSTSSTTGLQALTAISIALGYIVIFAV